uniref:Venom protein n=1 Tax=Hadrurus spadix TaxID=141984 RepID=A0A1W7R975_9SCOR
MAGMKIFVIMVLACLLIVNKCSAEGEEKQRPEKSRKKCIPKYKSCDHNPNGCCGNSSCRCTLLGTNCKCQRRGILQG